MIGEKGKLTGFEKETEMANGGVSCEEFMIKGRVLEKAATGESVQGTWSQVWQTRTCPGQSSGHGRGTAPDVAEILNVRG